MFHWARVSPEFPDHNWFESHLQFDHAIQIFSNLGAPMHRAFGGDHSLALIVRRTHELADRLPYNQLPRRDHGKNRGHLVQQYMCGLECNHWQQNKHKCFIGLAINLMWKIIDSSGMSGCYTEQIRSHLTFLRCSQIIYVLDSNEMGRPLSGDNGQF